MRQKKESMTEEDRGGDPAQELIQLSNVFVGRVWGHLQARVAEFSLSMPDAKALMSLPADGALSMRELAARLHANPSNVTVVVARLEARGLVTRQGVDDKRVKTVQLSLAGAELSRNLEDRLAQNHPAIVGLSQSQQQTLRQIFRRLSPGPIGSGG
jgi:DNA-binding MarR family transcriptional regulator